MKIILLIVLIALIILGLWYVSRKSSDDPIEDAFVYRQQLIELQDGYGRQAKVAQELGDTGSAVMWSQLVADTQVELDALEEKMGAPHS